MRTWRRGLFATGAGLILTLGPGQGLGAQSAPFFPEFTNPPTPAGSGVTAPGTAALPGGLGERSWHAPVASALLPGSGQWMLDQRRSVAYFAIEAAAVALHFERRGRGRSLRRAYRDLAWESARAGTAGPRRDGDFDYYERLSHFRSSGRLDTDPALAGIQPEENGATYNGRIWELARGLFLGGNPQPGPTDPGWDAAIAYYLERGYGDAFHWDWTGRDTALDQYRGTLRRSDDAFRRATMVLGVVMANHLVSAVDALMSSSGGLSQRLQLEAAPVGPPSGLGATWELELRIWR